jgi:hypothetical protein
MFVRIVSVILVLMLLSLCAIVAIAGFGIYDPFSFSKDPIIINWTLVILSIGSAFVIISSSWLLSMDSCIDDKNIPVKHISRSIMQNKVILVIDGTVFEKETIEWANVNLQFIEQQASRNFWGKVLLREIYINSEIQNFEIKTDERRSEEYSFDKDLDFQMGEDDDNGNEKEKKS